MKKFTRFEKHYPEYLAYNDDNKCARIVLDPATRTIEIYGVSGKKLSTSGVSYRDAMTGCPAMVALMDVREAPHRDDYWNFYQYADSCMTLGLTPIQRTWYNELLQIAATNKMIINATRACEIPPSNNYYTERDRNSAIYEAVMDMVVESKHLTEQEMQFFNTNGNNTDKGRFLNDEKYRHLVVKWGLAPVGRVIGVHSIHRYVQEYMDYCARADMPVETGDLWTNYIKVKATYEANRAACEERCFIASQKKFPLAYENDTFVVIVPMSKKECIDEGKKMHNCLGGYEWDNFLSNGSRQVVFIRRKTAPTKSYIACDIHDLRIHQYLAPCNNYVTDADALAFQQEYQCYLNTLQ